MPNSVLEFNIHSNSIACSVQLPLKELQFALDFDVMDFNEEKLKLHSKALTSYMVAHFKIKDEEGTFYHPAVQNISLNTSEQNGTGAYKELVINMLFTPQNKNANNRKFILLYDAITHQVASHKTLVTLKTDWESGDIDEATTLIGTIGLDVRTNTIKPFEINLDEGSLWKGFKSMVALGMKHISEGIDHLLFLIVLLLSAPLIETKGKWTKTSTIKQSIYKMTRITLAFTVGHSITLILGALNWIKMPQQPVEVLIAVSILVTAIHCIKPLFPKKETLIAAGFGLVHGLAFATVLSRLDLDSSKLALSLFGFNMGIELMQLIVVVLVMPWLLMISKEAIFGKVKSFGAIIAILLSLFWIVERVTGNAIMLSVTFEKMVHNAYWSIVVLASFVLTYRGIKQFTR